MSIHHAVRPTRRQALQLIGGSLLALPFTAKAAADQHRKRSSMGLVIYCLRYRRQQMQQQNQGDLYEPLTFLKQCHQLGAGGMQASLGVMDNTQINALRAYAEKYDLFIDAIIKPPKNHEDRHRFALEVQTAREAGALAARTVIMPGRRYERFRSLQEVREFEKRGEKMLQIAKPVVEKFRLPLAVENHKDQLIEDRVALFKRLDSEFIGACVDTGNSVALLDDPYEAVAALAPYAFSVHLKDQAVLEYEDGFLLGDVPLGRGALDLKRMVESLKKVKPKVRFALELITRDALKVPCRTEGYWNTMPENTRKRLSPTMRWVKQNPSQNLQEVSTLKLEKQVALEAANVAESLTYSRDTLGL